MEETANEQQFVLSRALETCSFLKEVALFSSLETDFLLDLANIVDEVHIFRGDVLFRQGDYGDSLYVIREGVLAVLVDGVEVATLGNKEFVGEMSLIDNEPRSATIKAIEDTWLLRISAGNFSLLLNQQPEIAFKLIQGIMQRFRRL